MVKEVLGHTDHDSHSYFRGLICFKINKHNKNKQPQKTPTNHKQKIHYKTPIFTLGT